MENVKKDYKNRKISAALVVLTLLLGAALFFCALQAKAMIEGFTVAIGPITQLFF